MGLDSIQSHGRPAEELSEEEVIELPKLAKRILKPGGYVLLIMNVEAFGEWYTSFRKAGFHVMTRLYVFAYDPDTIQDRNPTHTPQSGTDFGMLAYLPSESSFRPDFKSVFSVLGNKSKRNLALMTGIPMPKSKLCRSGTRSPFIPSEKSVVLLMEAIDLFSPKDGLTIDLFGGTLTTAMAAHMMKRLCICFEKKADLFKEAVERLTNIVVQPNIVHSHDLQLCSDLEQTDPVPLTPHDENETDDHADNNSNEDADMDQIPSGVPSTKIAFRNNGNSTITDFDHNIGEEDLLSPVTENTDDVDMPENNSQINIIQQGSGQKETKTISWADKSSSIVTESKKVNDSLHEIHGLQALAAAAEQNPSIAKSGIKRVTSLVTSKLGSFMGS